MNKHSMESLLISQVNEFSIPEDYFLHDLPFP